MGKYRCNKCGGPVNLHESYKVAREYGTCYSKNTEILCANCLREIFNDYYDHFDNIDDAEENEFPIEEAALYYLSSGDPEDTYGYTQEELEEYLKNG